MTPNLVWLKRDLRLQDHAPLFEAACADLPVIVLYILEPERWQQPDVDPIHIEWELDTLRSLKGEFEALGGVLLVRQGDAVQVLDDLRVAFGFTRMFSHEETGTMWSWDRDKRVASWARSSGVKWSEYPSNGVIRSLPDRDNWKALRDRRIQAESIPTPTRLAAPDNAYSDKIPTMHELGLHARGLIGRPLPGRQAACDTLESFLEERGRPYRWAMSGPEEATRHCSRLSPYLSVGVLSIREVDHAVGLRMRTLRRNPEHADDAAEWLKSLSSFRSRLAWHCHFIQKLESETTIDTIAQNPVLDDQLDRAWDQDRFDAWKEGRTGLPFLDACMRQLTATGWINFRMRAMLQSVASYALWLPWRETGLHLARLFLDYEPGIHWSQVGMQSGTTGINTVRAYSVLKQSKDHDPEGTYIRRWVRELANVPTAYIHEPWNMPLMEQQMAGCIVGIDYPEPIVNEGEARRAAVAKVYAARRTPAVRRKSSDVVRKHGSRKRRRG